MGNTKSRRQNDSRRGWSVFVVVVMLALGLSLPTTASAERNHVGDVSGDGRADLIGWNDASKWVQLSTGSAFSDPEDWFEGTAFYGSKADLVGDVNGDGRADLIGWNDASKWVQLSTGPGFTAPQDWFEGTAFYGSKANLVGDVNGDGRADLIGWNDASKWVQLSTGSGFTGPLDWFEGTAFYGSKANLVGDVNGDGKDDLIGWNDASKWVQLSTGSGFTAPQDWFEGTAFYGSRANLVGDVNGDGKDDLIGWNDASKWVQLSTGSGFTAPQDWFEGTAFYGTSGAQDGDAGPGGGGASISQATHKEYEWRILDVSDAYRTAGQWHFCAQSHSGMVSCSRSFTVANTVSGSIAVSTGLLSAQLGYSVTRSTTLAGSASFPVPPGKVAVAEWRPLFNTRAVYQQQWARKVECSRWCSRGKWFPTLHIQTAYANRYVGPDFRRVVH